MKTLIFSHTVFGHHLEYLHHLYMRALELPRTSFVFAIPDDFHSVSSKMEWPKAENIEFVFFSAKQVKTSFARSRYLGKVVRKYEVDEVVVVTLMLLLPWLPLFVPAKVKVSGIIYLIYLYRWAKSGWKTRILDVLKYIILAKFNVFHRIFLLNDKVSPRYLNRKFRTNKFEWLPDPIAISEKIVAKDIREDLSIPSGKKIVLHFGGLTDIFRKGTLELIRAAGQLGSKEDFVFVFAGRVGESVAEIFYGEIRRATQKGANIIVFDEFCSYEFLLNLTKTSDVVVIPYKNSEQSSGVIAYAALAGTPVVGPSRGLLGKLIGRYMLGKTIDDISPEGIACELGNNTWNVNPNNRKGYLSDNRLPSFQKIILPNPRNSF